MNGANCSIRISRRGAFMFFTARRERGKEQGGEGKGEARKMGVTGEEG